MRHAQARALAVIWTIVVVGLHLIPRLRLHQMPGGVILTSTSWLDKLAHVFLFGVLAAAWRRGFSWNAKTVLVGGLFFGFALEVCQEWFIRGRSGDAIDLMTDGVGLLIGVWMSGGTSDGNSTEQPD